MIGAPLRCAAARWSSSEVSAENGTVCVDAAIAKEGPIPARRLDERSVAFGDEQCRLGARFGDYAAERVADERMPEEFNSIRSRLILVPDAIGRCNEHSVGDCVRTLRGAPCVDLGLAVLGFFRRMPADRRRIKNDFRA